MNDDAALLLRVAAFGLVAAAVYWYLSYEAFGTVALVVLGAGPGFAGLYALRHRRRDAASAESRSELVRRFAGLPKEDPPGPKALRDEDLAVLPMPSIWPLGASLGLAVAGSGLIFGLWLAILGLAIALYSGWGWIAAIIRETRYGRLRPAGEAPEPQEPGEPGEPEQETQESLRRRR